MGDRLIWLSCIHQKPMKYISFLRTSFCDIMQMNKNPSISCFVFLEMNFVIYFKCKQHIQRIIHLVTSLVMIQLKET